MEAQDYVSKIVRLEKVHRAMGIKIPITAHWFVTLSPLRTGYTRVKPFRAVFAVSLESRGK
jgi:hypothetical protein